MSGSVLNVVDLLGADAGSGESTIHKPIICKGVITAIASSPRDGVIAIAEKGKLNIKLMKWPGGMLLGLALQGMKQ